MKNSSQDLLKVKFIFDFLSKKDLEKSEAKIKHIDLIQIELDFLNEKLIELTLCHDPDLQKLSQLNRLLKPHMSSTEWLSLIIPFERALHKNPVDADFIITTTDNLKAQRKTYPLRLVLDSFRSAFNVGSVFRTSECLGVEHIYLCGYTATPENEKVHKAALGTETQVPWSYHENTVELLKSLKSQFHLIGLETSPQATLIHEKFQIKPTLFILGNERFGLDSTLLELCDEVRKIPLMGTKNSLNAATCGALAVYEWTSQLSAKWDSK